MWEPDREPEPVAGGPTADPEPTGSALLPLLAEPRRRRLLRTVRREAPASLGALAGELAAADASTARATPRRCREVYLEVHHVDVPLLSGAGLVRYDEDTGTVSLAVPEATLDAVLADVDERLSTTG